MTPGARLPDPVNVPEGAVAIAAAPDGRWAYRGKVGCEDPQCTRTGPAERGYTTEEILSRVKLWALITGRPPTKVTWSPAHMRKLVKRLHERVAAWQEAMALYEDGDWPSETTVRNHFGSLNAALEAAGFEPRSPGRQPADGELELSRTDGIGPGVVSRAIVKLAEAQETERPLDVIQALSDLSEVAASAADAMARKLNGAAR